MEGATVGAVAWENNGAIVRAMAVVTGDWVTIGAVAGATNGATVGAIV